MNKCPKCNEEINSIIDLQDVIISYEITVNESGKLNCNEVDSTSGDHLYYRCPVCYADIEFENENQVADFLNGAI